MAEAAGDAVDYPDMPRLPDLQEVSDLARMQFADMLSCVHGQKDLVIQAELMTLLEHVTPIGFLRK